jgi:spermidine synthase
MAEPKLIYSVTEAEQVIKVWQQDELRWLEFGDELIQTEIALDKPTYLPESFSRAMLSGVMFTQQPKRVLLAGTGGGSTARYFASRFPGIKGDAVELSPAVIDIAQRYFDCPNGGNWELIEADIRQYVQTCSNRYDLIVMDIAIDQKTPDWLNNETFLSHCRSILTPTGHIAINLIVENADDFVTRLAAIREAFDRHTVCLSLDEHRNVLVFAFNHIDPVGTELASADLDILEAQWQVEFGQFYQQMLLDNPKGSGVL